MPLFEVTVPLLTRVFVALEQVDIAPRRSWSWTTSGSVTDPPPTSAPPLNTMLAAAGDPFSAPPPEFAFSVPAPVTEAPLMSKIPPTRFSCVPLASE